MRAPLARGLPLRSPAINKRGLRIASGSSLKSLVGWLPEDFDTGLGPHEKAVPVVPVGDEGADLLVECGHGGDVGLVQGLAFGDPGPHLHEVQSEGRGRCEVHPEPGIFGHPSLHQRVPVHGVVSITGCSS